MNDNELKYNGERYVDPTAYEAISNVEAEAEAKEADRDRVYRLRGCIFRVCELAGFKIEGKIALKDVRTGKVWR